MSTLIVDMDGQVTFDHDLLKHLGVEPGDKIIIEKLRDGRLEMKAARKAGCISDAFGVLKRENGPSLSIEEMNEAIAQGWTGEPLP